MQWRFLVLASFLAVLACGPEPDGAEPEPHPEPEGPAIEAGAPGGPCFSNGTCNGSYSCVEGYCLAEEGALGGPCRAAEPSCDEGLSCDANACLPSGLDAVEVTVDATPAYVSVGDQVSLTVQTASFPSCDVVFGGRVVSSLAFVSGVAQATFSAPDYSAATFLLRCGIPGSDAMWSRTLPVQVVGIDIASVEEGPIVPGDTFEVCASAHNVGECVFAHDEQTVPCPLVSATSCLGLPRLSDEPSATISCAPADGGDYVATADIVVPGEVDLAVTYDAPSEAREAGTSVTLDITWSAPPQATSCDILFLPNVPNEEALVVASNAVSPSAVEVTSSGKVLVRCRLDDETQVLSPEDAVPLIRFLPDIDFYLRPPFNRLLGSEDFPGPPLPMVEWDEFAFRWEVKDAATCSLVDPAGVTSDVPIVGELLYPWSLWPAPDLGAELSPMLSCLSYGGDVASDSLRVLAYQQIALHEDTTSSEASAFSTVDVPSRFYVQFTMEPSITEASFHAAFESVRSVNHGELGSGSLIALPSGSFAVEMPRLRFLPDADAIRFSPGWNAKNDVRLPALEAAELLHFENVDVLEIGGDIRYLVLDEGFSEMLVHRPIRSNRIELDGDFSARPPLRVAWAEGVTPPLEQPLVTTALLQFSWVNGLRFDLSEGLGQIHVTETLRFAYACLPADEFANILSAIVLEPGAIIELHQSGPDAESCP